MEQIHVSPAGDDSWPGSQDRPFATLERARAAARAAGGKAVVHLRGGVHVLTRPFELGGRRLGDGLSGGRLRHPGAGGARRQRRAGDHRLAGARRRGLAGRGRRPRHPAALRERPAGPARRRPRPARHGHGDRDRLRHRQP
ncbi:hypothetical protein [Nonomuraea salmonea]|uniref:hypothetical protein n=1 Tax=Nonomuraea salmonea TaxID=46181 RepID=UPI0031E5DD6F